MAECPGCGEVLTRRSQRVYCSVRCQRDLERRVRVAAWLETGVAQPGSHDGHYVRRHIDAEQGGRCALCGLCAEWNGVALVLVLDHVDGDPTHNRRENLRLICPNCDSQLPTYKSRNWGSGRHLRRQRYADGKSY